MPQSLSRVIVHMVFSTKHRFPFIDEAFEKEMYAYLASVLKTDGHVPIKIGGTEDHVHLMFGQSRTISVAKTVENLKSSSSKWAKTKGGNLSEFAWQLGYGIFSVSPTDTDGLEKYIANQRDHHKSLSFQDEYRALLNEHGIPFDEKYVWD